MTNVYFPSYSSAIRYCFEEVNKRFAVNTDEWFNQMSIGGAPAEGTTKKGIISLNDIQTGKELKRCLSIQVYNRGIDGNTFELNYYIG